MTPTNPGWYWFMAKEIWAGAGRDKEPRMRCVRVFRVEGELVVEFGGFIDSYEFMSAYDSKAGEWLGEAIPP